MGDGESGVRHMGVKIWRTRELDRTEWASVVRETKAKHKGTVVLKQEQKC
jgi:hypothetical protein